LGVETDTTAWPEPPEPRPLPTGLPAVPSFKLACLPNTIRRWIEDISERMQCPPDFPAVGVTIALGSLIGRKIGIRPKRFDDWLVIPNLWGFIVGRPGLMKTPALEHALSPLRRLAAEAMKRYDVEMQKNGVDAILRCQRKKVAEGRIIASLKKDDEGSA